MSYNPISRVHNKRNGAPVSSWPNHIPSHAPLELCFVERFGPDIDHTYLIEFGNLLEDIGKYIWGAQIHEKKKDFACSIMLCSLLCTQSKNGNVWVEIKNVSVRPCAQKIGFFRLFMWKLIEVCRDTGYNLRVDNPPDDMVRILFLISPKFKVVPETRKVQLMYDDLVGIPSKQLSVDHMLVSKHIKVTAFPSSQNLNDQEFLNSRLANRQWHHPVIPFRHAWHIPQHDDAALYSAARLNQLKMLSKVNM
jgi:hypothetical protein